VDQCGTKIAVIRGFKLKNNERMGDVKLTSMEMMIGKHGNTTLKKTCHSEYDDRKRGVLRWSPFEFWWFNMGCS